MPRVFIISDYLMFSHGLQSLLNDANVLIIGQETNTEEAIDKIESLDPDIILYDETIPAEESKLDIIPILQENPDMKVVGLNLHSNNIHIYQSETHSIPGETGIQGVADLVNVLQSEL